MNRFSRFTSVVGNTSKRYFSTGGGGGDKPPWRNWSIPKAHYISGVSIEPWLKRLLLMGKKKNSYKVYGRHLFLHVLNNGGEQNIMESGLMATPGRYTGSMVRAHTVEDKEIPNVERYLPGNSQYYFITNTRARQDQDLTLTGVEWDVMYLETIGWVMRLPDGSFFIGGELQEELGNDGKNPKE